MGLGCGGVNDELELGVWRRVGTGAQVVMGLGCGVIDDELDSEEKGNCVSMNLTCLET